MKVRIGLGIVLALLVASAQVDAQLGGILKKKAGDIVGGKKTPAPEPPPPTPTTTTGSETPAPTAATPPAAAPPAAAPAPAAAKKASNPLDVSALDLPRKANAVLRGDIEMQDSGEWMSLPYIGELAVASARALDEASQVALVETVGAALKTLVSSDKYVADFNAYIRNEHKAADHGIAGLVSTEDMLKKGDQKALEARLQRDQVVAVVDSLADMSANNLKPMFDESMKDWTKYAAQPTRKDRAKYEKLAAQGQALQPLMTTDIEKFRRGYATLRIAENDGPATEEAVFAAYARAKEEAEQIAWDQHNLKGQLKRQLATFIAVAPTVDFAAATHQKGGKTIFTNPAFEKKGAIWKACFRAGKGPTAAALQLARAWVKEL